MHAHYWADPETARAVAAARQAKEDPEARRLRHAAWYARNREQQRELHRQWYLANREGVLARGREQARLSGTYRKALLRKYGLDEAAYGRLLAAQGGVCGICGGPPNGMDPIYHVDHDHSTQAVRGLLCNKCNRGIGNLGDSIPVLEAAIAYLRRFA